MYISFQLYIKIYVLGGDKYFKEIFLPMYYLYMNSKSQAIADIIRKLIVEQLTRDNQLEFLNWFVFIYLNDTWGNFHHISVKTPGIQPTQQHIEACNKGIKTVLDTQMNINAMTLTGIPKLLIYLSEETYSGKLIHGECNQEHYITNGIILPEKLKKALDILKFSSNYLKMGNKNNPNNVIYFVNSNEYVINNEMEVKPMNIVSNDRVKRYIYIYMHKCIYIYYGLLNYTYIQVS